MAKLLMRPTRRKKGAGGGVWGGGEGSFCRDSPKPFIFSRSRVAILFDSILQRSIIYEIVFKERIFLPTMCLNIAFFEQLSWDF